MEESYSISVYERTWGARIKYAFEELGLKRLENGFLTEMKVLGKCKKDSWFSHIAIEVSGENSSNEWCEPVNDEYNKL